MIPAKTGMKAKVECGKAETGIQRKVAKAQRRERLSGS